VIPASRPAAQSEQLGRFVGRCNPVGVDIPRFCVTKHSSDNSIAPLSLITTSSAEYSIDTTGEDTEKTLDQLLIITNHDRLRRFLRSRPVNDFMMFVVAISRKDHGPGGSSHRHNAVTALQEAEKSSDCRCSTCL
jgi:hypothetical protein